MDPERGLVLTVEYPPHGDGVVTEFDEAPAFRIDPFASENRDTNHDAVLAFHVRPGSREIGPA